MLKRSWIIVAVVTYLTLLTSCSNEGWKFVSPMPKAGYKHDATLGHDGNIYVMGGWVYDVTEKGNGTDYSLGVYSCLKYEIKEDKYMKGDAVRLLG